MFRQSKIVLSYGVLLCFGIILPVESAPSINAKSPWRDENGLLPEIVDSPNCDPATGRCWGWLPMLETRNEANYALEQDPELERAQSIHIRGVEHASSDPWQEIPYVSESQNFKNSLATNNQGLIGGNGRLSKKDVLTSRGWGAGGMPFSVLYMSPRTNHASGSGGSSSDTGKSAQKNTIPRSSTKPGQPNYRLAPRHSNYSQPRRRYSMIPQLLLSYDWNPSGK